MMTDQPPSRRKFLKYFGVSGAGVAFISDVEVSKEKIKTHGEDAKEELEKLRLAYEELDRRTKLILRVVLVLSGLNVFF